MIMLSLYFYCISIYITLFSFSVHQADCRNATRIARASGLDAPVSIGQYPLGFTQVVSEAGNIFKNFLSKMVENKKILGFNADWPQILG